MNVLISIQYQNQITCVVLLLVDIKLASAEKKIKTEEKEGKEAKELKFQDVIANRVDKVGTVDPVKDFKAMMERRDDPAIISAGIQQLSALIREMVKKSMGNSAFPKVSFISFYHLVMISAAMLPCSGPGMPDCAAYRCHP